jgi:hypothetical protein
LICDRLPAHSEKEKRHKAMELDAIRAQYPNGAAAYEVLDFIRNQGMLPPSEKSATRQ